jgi:hypothetical protein
MDRSKAVIPVILLMSMLFLIGVGGLLRYSEKLLDSSENVRIVHVVGIIAAGVTCGASITGMIGAVVVRRTRVTTDNRPQVK